MSDNLIQIRGSMPAVQDHSRHYGEYAFVYPVVSRRSGGLSLGVNLNPDKVCNFDCVYCEVDRRIPGRASRVDVTRMRDELVALIRLVKAGGLERDPRFRDLPSPVVRKIRDIAFSGDGEPTMVSCFAECVQAVAEVKRVEGLEFAKIVLITDAAGLDKADVRRGLEIMDANRGEVWGKLDAGTDAYYRLVNRSHVRFDRILANLLATARVRPIVIQSLFLRVDDQLISAAELTAYCGRLNDLTGRGGRIREVHAYTIARATPEPYATRLEPDVLDRVAAEIRRQTGLAVLSFP